MIKTRSDEDKIELSLKRAASHFLIPKFRLKIEWTATLGSDFSDKVPDPCTALTSFEIKFTQAQVS